MSYEEFDKYIFNRGGKIVDGDKKIACKNMYTIQCLKDDYIWTTSYVALINGTWCSRCSKKIIKTYDEVKEIVECKNGTLLSTTNDLVNKNSKLKIQCENGHIWTPPYNSIMNNHWCPKCRATIQQNQLMIILCDILKSECICNFRGFDWLRLKRNLEIDIWFPELKLAVEYDGVHHFMPIYHCFKSNECAQQKLIETKKRDRIKNKLISEHLNEVKYFIRFNYKEKLDYDYVKSRLINTGVL
jgi:hypothetical protein